MRQAGALEVEPLPLRGGALRVFAALVALGFEPEGALRLKGAAGLAPSGGVFKDELSELGHRRGRGLVPAAAPAQQPGRKLEPETRQLLLFGAQEGEPHDVAEDGQLRPTDAISENELHTAIIDEVIARALPADMLDKNTRIFVNPTGRFLIGGPAGDSGLTGRKLIVDTYGGYAHHGGGAFSGKDSSKVDRSAAYMARYLAKNVVAAGLADRCEVQLSYAIGVAQPVSVLVDTFGTEKVDREKIQALVSTVDMRPAAIIKRFDLRSPRFSEVSCYGHFGENAKDMPWEKTDLAEGWKMA